jgi:hypothetical protein
MKTTVTGKGKIDNPLYWEERVKKVYKENVFVFQLSSKIGTCLLQILMDDRTAIHINWDWILSNEWTLHKVELDYRFIPIYSKKVTTTKDFWACQCGRPFIHHKIEFTCKKCGCTVTNNQSHKITYVEDIFNWWEVE